MEKLIFMFARRAGMSREAYQDHYVNSHIPIGLRLTGGLDGYTVNLVNAGGSDVDAVTEIWTPSAAAQCAGENYATPEDRAAVMADGDVMHGPRDQRGEVIGLLVQEDPVVNGVIDGPGEGPWIKAIALLPADEDPGEPASEAYRVVDNRVTGVMIGDRLVDPGSADAPDHRTAIALIRMTWARDAAALPAAGPRTLIVRELRNIVPAAV